MPLASGTKLGPYEIIAPLGAGGMGEVYRVRDTRLNREVAVKVLSAQFSNDLERLHRFEQEARAASALNHPNIITIHDIGRQDGTAYLAMEFVEGKTLRELLIGGPLPLKRALAIAAQVADGLAKAHAAGIVHRDLKPENVMVTGDGLVKILDFGLAKLAAPQAPEATATVLSPGTVPGLVMGTVGYMSPEQARGEAVDFHSDQFSLGTLLYEALTTKRPFERASSAQTMAAIIEDDPAPLSELNPKTPVALHWIIERCLAKEPEERYAATRDLARDLLRVRDHLSEAGTGSALGVTPPPAIHARRWIPTVLIFAALLVGFALGALLFPGKTHEPPVVQNLTFSGDDHDPAVSPDGRAVVFASTRDGKPRIWLKQLPAGAEVPITEGPDFEPRFSPDGSMIVFTRHEETRFSVYRTSVVGGEVRRLAEGRTPDWSRDGKQIAFTRDRSIWTMQRDGSDLRELAKLEITNAILRAVRWSPDGKWLAVESVAGGISSENVSFQLVSSDGQKILAVKPAFRGGDLSAVAWVSNDEVLYARSSSVSSVGPVNINASRLIQQKVPSGKSWVVMWLAGGSGTVEPAGEGRLIADLVATRENLREVSLQGGTRQSGADRWLTHGSSIDRQPRWSPDGEWVVFSSNRSGNLDLWKVSTKTGVIRRLTDDPSDDWDPGFTPDGNLIWTSHRSGNFEIWMADADGSGAHQVSHDGVDAENATATPDGWVIYNSASKQPGLWKVRADGSQASLLVPGVNNWPEASPDGKYVLATSVKADRIQHAALSRPDYIGIYRASDGSEVSKISVNATLLVGAGIGRARWTPDGKAIVFIDSEGSDLEGIYRQDFVPGQDTSATRRLLISDPDLMPETFALSPDGTKLVYAVIDSSSNLLTIDGVSGIGK